MEPISSSAEIGADTELGFFCVIGENVSIGAYCRIGHHVVIHADTVIGDGVRIDDNAVIGKKPMRSATSVMTQEKELEGTRVGDACIIGTSVVIYRGASIGQKVLVADFASVREDVVIGEYSVIGRGVTVENKVTIGRRTKIETEAYITALSEIGDYCFIAPEVTFTNDNFMGRSERRFQFHKGVTVRRGGRVGANATVLPGVVIEEDGVVGAGAVVTHDVPTRTVVFGAPARSRTDVPEEQLLEKQKGFQGSR